MKKQRVIIVIGAIEALSRTLTIEFAQYGITVNIIHPSLTRTNSSAPLDMPKQFMKDPSMVGKKLAGKIGSTRPVITPGAAKSAGVFYSRMFPGMMGRFMSKKAAEAREKVVK